MKTGKRGFNQINKSATFHQRNNSPTVQTVLFSSKDAKILKHITLYIDATFVFDCIPAHPLYWGGGKEKKEGGRMKDILMIRKAATMKYD